MTALSLDMDSNALHDWIASNGPVHAVFNAKSEDMESYPEEGIQCLITGGLEKRHRCVHVGRGFHPI